MPFADPQKKREWAKARLQRLREDPVWLEQEKARQEAYRKSEVGQQKNRENAQRAYQKMKAGKAAAEKLEKKLEANRVRIAAKRAAAKQAAGQAAA